MSNDTKEERESHIDIDKTCAETNCSFQYDPLEQSLEIPTFEFSSPISSIGSTCSSPDRERTIQQMLDQNDSNGSSDYVSLDDLQSQISPPSDGDFCKSPIPPHIDVLETIFEDCYLETPPGTPTTPRPKKGRRFRLNLSSFDEFKENVQNNHKQPENK